MKKLFLFISCFFATMSVLADAMYTYDESSKSYIYQGEPVSEFSVDFTTWETTALPDKIYDADGATENGNMAFVKWVIANRSIQMTPSETAVKKNVAFNKGKTDDDTPVTNKDTENKPRIYLPTTANGVKKITAHMAVASTSSRSLLIYYKDENHPDWTYVKDQAISIQTTNKYDVAEATYELNTAGKTSIYLQYNSTDFFCVLDIALDIEPIEYAYNETTQRYDYIGEPLEETLEVDFTQLLTTKKAFNTVLGTNVHADTCLEFEHVGLYKWCHNLDNRSCEGTTYTDVLSNYGNSDVNGTKTANNASDLAAELKPTVYLPTVKNGISKIIVEGWTNDNTSGNLYIQAKDVLTNTWKSINKVDGSITKSVFALGNNTYTKDTLVINNRNIKDVLFYRQHTPYQFITKITIIPMEGLPEVVIDENEDNEAVLKEYKDQTVNLTINRVLKAGSYNTFCLPCTLNVAAFKQAIDDEGCDVRYFNAATMENGGLNLTFTNVSNIGPGFACLVKPTKDIEEPIVLENVKIEYTTGRNIARPAETPLVKFFSTFKPVTLQPNKNTLVLSADNTLYFVDEEVTMKSLRGHFSLYNDAARAAANKMPMRAIFPNDAPTDIEPMYDADCQMHNGKYLINGQFVIIREGKRYNVLGY